MKNFDIHEFDLINFAVFPVYPWGWMHFCCMHPCRTKQSKVFYPVIVLAVIYMMDYLTLIKITANRLLNNIAMFGEISTLLDIRMIRNVYINISATVDFIFHSRFSSAFVTTI
jgi:hypothetical protein